MEKFSIKEILGEMKKNDSGLIMIVALGILVMMSYVSIILTQQIIETNKMVERWHSVSNGETIADSIMEKLKFQYGRGHEAGWSQNVICKTDGTTAETTANTTGSTNKTEYMCSELLTKKSYPGNKSQSRPEMTEWERGAQMLDMVIRGQGEKVQVEVEVKGRTAEEDKFTENTCPLIFGDEKNCYKIPLKEMGTAEEGCERAPERVWEDPDHPCNWSKLRSGSPDMKRIAIPLYYEVEKEGEDNSWKIIQPFKGETNAPFANFALRLRTPCIPCVDNTEDVIPNVNMYCADPKNTCVRYELDDRDETREENEIVVQWQVMGKCDEDEDGEYERDCGVIPYISYDKFGKEKGKFSAISEKRINDAEAKFGNEQYMLIYNKTHCISTDYLEKEAYNPPFLIDKIKEMDKPVLILMLTEKLRTPFEDRIPYLEYQFVSDVPVSSPVTKFYARATSNGFGATREKYMYRKTPLIDFAISN